MSCPFLSLARSSSIGIGGVPKIHEFEFMARSGQRVNYACWDHDHAAEPKHAAKPESPQSLKV